MNTPIFRSDCPVASALDIPLDRWSLVIVRDMIFGAATFSDFAASTEHIPRNMLAERLTRLETAGTIWRERYQERPERFRYRLTALGAELLPVIQVLSLWGAKHVPHAYDPPPELLSLQPQELVG